MIADEPGVWFLFCWEGTPFWAAKLKGSRSSCLGGGWPQRQSQRAEAEFTLANYHAGPSANIWTRLWQKLEVLVSQLNLVGPCRSLFGGPSQIAVSFWFSFDTTKKGHLHPKDICIHSTGVGLVLTIQCQRFVQEWEKPAPTNCLCRGNLLQNEES